MNKDLTKGPITKNLILFTIPMILGNMLQQLYNVADTFIVGKYLGANALAAVGSAYTLMIFLTSIILGLCMGSGAVFAIRYGEGSESGDALKNSIFVSFILIAVITLLITAAAFLSLDYVLILLRVPAEITTMMREYLQMIFFGIGFTFFYNFLACLLRAIGNSVAPLIFLAVAALLNIVLDVLFVGFWGVCVMGAALATVIAQGVSAGGLWVYTFLKTDVLKLYKKHLHISLGAVREVFSLSALTCVQQSVMNFGILMIQGLVNSFGTTIMAAFAVAVKIDSFAYMPVQDFGNAFSVFTSQNFGAKKHERIRKGFRSALVISSGFSVLLSLLVCLFAKELMLIFINPQEVEILAAGVWYLRIEGAFYIGIGCLFLLYGYYRAIKKPLLSVILAIVSLGTRVLLATILAGIPAMGVTGIWMAIPIGWFLADAIGIVYYLKKCCAK